MKIDQQLTQGLIHNSKQHLEPLRDPFPHRTNRPVIGGSSIFQAIMFNWVLPLIAYGHKQTVGIEDMPQLPESHSTSNQYLHFFSLWQTTAKSKWQGWTLIKALFKVHKKQWILLVIATILQVSLLMASPVLTALNIDYLKNHKDSLSLGIILFLLTFMVALSHRIIYSQYLFRFMNIGIRLSILVSTIIYSKALKYSPLADKQFREAEIINYSQVDSERLVAVGDQLSAFLYGPLQIVVGLVMMYYILGFTFLATIAVIVVVMAASYFFSKITVKLNREVLRAKDERMKVTEEMLDIIRYIKISAIQKFFYKKIDEKRAIEVSVIIKQGVNFIYVACLLWLTSPLLLASAYLTFILLGNQISPEVAFTTMTIVSLFQSPIYSLPNAVSEWIQILTSLKRIEKFLFAQEIKSYHISFVDDSEMAVRIREGNFYWKKEEQIKRPQRKREQHSNENVTEIMNQHDEDLPESCHSATSQTQKEERVVQALRDINIDIKKGFFTMIVGDIGSGKSTLLQAIINEALVIEGSRIQISGNIAYSPQKPWIMSKTLRQNIVFAQPHDQEKFKTVLHYACLEEDLKMLPKGAQTEIGEKGINLSGGQKARVSLARCLYSGRDILLLDDILSAVDVTVGSFIVEQTLKHYLRGKTVVMPTHALKFAAEADYIIVMEKGRIVKSGSYRDISNSEEFNKVSLQQKVHESKEQSDRQKEAQLKEEIPKQQPQTALKIENRSVEGEVENKTVEDLILPEDHRIGEIGFAVVKQFISLSGGTVKFVGVISISMLLYLAVKTFASIWIKMWCNNPSENQSEVYIFIALHALSIVFLFFAAHSIIFGGARQSTTVHKEIIKHLLSASLGNFYNRVPTGRIINRLTKDLRELDEVLMYCLLYFLTNAFDLLGAFAICVYATSPFILIPIVVLAYLANLLRRYFMKTQREVTRFQQSTNSPIVSGLLSTVSGLATIRAFNKQSQFSEWQYGYFDVNKRVRLTKNGIKNWFANTLAYLCFLVNMPCIAYCLFSQEDDPAVIGLLMTYALTLTYSASRLILYQTDVQTKLISAERLYKFMSIEPEEKFKEHSQNWSAEEQEILPLFAKGEIQFRAVRVRYREDLPDVIKGITCLISPGQKIGIVGRTGAGKTTIINALLRITQISGGQILIDGRSLQDLALRDVRQSVTMIDQDPTLIKSTFRQNLDLTQRYSDSELEKILRQCNLWQRIANKGGLDAAVSNTSLSAGQKQLLCICRAFLKKSKVILIDEATANIDVRNDETIQKVIEQKFRNSTVLTIAHRLSTLSRSDRVMVMEGGQLVQFGSPAELCSLAGGLYAAMLKEDQDKMLK